MPAGEPVAGVSSALGAGSAFGVGASGEKTFPGRGVSRSESLAGIVPEVPGEGGGGGGKKEPAGMVGPSTGGWFGGRVSPPVPGFDGRVNPWVPMGGMVASMGL